MLASLRGLKTVLKNISPINETKLDKRGRKHICVHGGKEGFISETIRQSKITRIPFSNCDFYFYFQVFFIV